MVTVGGIRFALKRISGSLKGLFKNKMAIVGLILLSGFVFAALAAPLLTPYGPQERVSGVLAQPDWVMNYPDGYYLSKNLVLPSTGTLTSPASIQEWTLSASPTTLASLQESYAQGITERKDSKGSLQLTYTGDGPGTVRIGETFQYPYRGPPTQFIANIHYLLTGASNASRVNVRVFIDRMQLPSAQEYLLLNQNESASGLWLPNPSYEKVYSLDTNNQDFRNFLK